jgi:HEAT repeat protein
VERFGADGVRSVARLAPLIRDPDGEVRRAVVAAFTNLPYRTAIDALVVALGDGEEAVRRAALQGLMRLSESSFEKVLEGARPAIVASLVGAARQSPPELAGPLLDLSARVGAHDAVEPMIALLDSPLRGSAAVALAEVFRAVGNDARADIVAALRPLLGDPDPEVVMGAAVTLATAADDARGRSILLELAHAPTAAAEGVLSGATAEAPREVRFDAIRALGRLTDPATRAVLLGILRDSEAEVRGAACEALGSCGDARTIDVLRKIQMNDPDPAVKEKAKFAIMDIRERNRIADEPPPVQPPA